jgi:hypothetical protein
MHESRELRLAQRLVRRNAALEDRIQLLAKKYTDVPVGTIRQLSTLDPSGPKGSYLEWMVRRIHDGNIRWPEDSERLNKAIQTYHSLKRSPRLLQEHGVSPDINTYTLHNLESIHDKVHGTELKTQRETHEESKAAGAQVIYDKTPYKIIKIGGAGVDPDQAVKAACIYAKETKWCTSGESTAKSYLEKGPLYVIFEKGVKIAQTDGGQVMDVKDEPISMKGNIKFFELLKSLGIMSTSRFNIKYALEVVEGRLPAYAERSILRDPTDTVMYARQVIKGRWPEAEPKLLDSDLNQATIYAASLLKKRWVDLEKRIVNIPTLAVQYVCSILKKRWPEAEPSIIKNPKAASNYASCALKTRWPEAEPVIMTDAWAATTYAEEILNDRWPQAEPVIMKSPGSAAHYASEIMEHTWPEAEPYIIKDAEAAAFYAMLLKGRWPEAEPVIRQNGEMWEQYSAAFLED